MKRRFQGEFTHKGKQTIQSVYVINTLKRNLLGLPTIQVLNLAVRVDIIIQPSGCAVADKFPSIFQGLGNFGDSYTIKLKPGATPYAIYTPKHVAMPLRDRMESLNVTLKVEEPTPWCAGMVVVPKKNGTIRIFVYLKPLNESVQREMHPFPAVDDTLAQLTGAKVFSTVDANSGFWQVPLAPFSRLLTTFLTPYGQYCFSKLPFGTS